MRRFFSLIKKKISSSDDPDLANCSEELREGYYFPSWCPEHIESCRDCYRKDSCKEYGAYDDVFECSEEPEPFDSWRFDPWK